MAIVDSPLNSKSASGRIGTQIHRPIAGRHIVQATSTKPYQDTANRQEARTTTTGLSQYWQSLSQAQRDAWTLYDRQHPRFGRFNAPLPVSGYAAFFARSWSRFRYSGTACEDIPTDIATPDMTITQMSEIESPMWFELGALMGALPGTFVLELIQSLRSNIPSPAVRRSGVRVSYALYEPYRVESTALSPGWYTFWLRAIYLDNGQEWESEPMQYELVAP